MRAVFTCGRFNPPTVGHRRLVERLRAEASASGGQARLFATASHDPARNPLPVGVKLDFLRRAFPEVPVEVAVNPIRALEALAEQGVTEAVVLLGQDRGDLGAALVRRGGELGLAVEVVLVERPPEAASATEARDACRANDRARFDRLAASADPAWRADVFAAVRQGMEETG